MDTCKPMQCHMRGKLKLFSRWRFPVGGGRWAGKVWPTGFSWENVRALLRRSYRTQPRFSALILVHIRGKTVANFPATRFLNSSLLHPHRPRPVLKPRTTMTTSTSTNGSTSTSGITSTSTSTSGIRRGNTHIPPDTDTETDTFFWIPAEHAS
jgi:hypothetical protein